MTEITNADVIKGWGSAPRSAVEEHGDEGDFARQHLLNPALFKLLGDVQDKRILDAGCGQGYLCRLLARKGAVVTGLEPAQTFYNYAVEREQQEPLGITYLQQDLSLLHGLDNSFHCVISNMVFMDIPDYTAAMRNCIASLMTAGDFIFSITHPCFEEPAREWTHKGFVAVREYFDEFAIPSQYGPWFHRPLSTYLNLVLHHGCTLQEIIEPRLAPELVHLHGLQHARNAHVPQFLIVHARKEQI